MAHHSVRNALKAFAAALQFLTRLPVPARLAGAAHEDGDFRRSVAFFPAAGFVIGVLLALAGWLLGSALPPLVAAVLVTVLWIGVTGALHMDGLMDTADGLLSHRSRERMLEIMKDSRVGAMGVVAGTLAALLRAALLASLLPGQGAFAAAVLTVVPVWSRAFLATAIAGWPYARADSGGGFGGLFRTVKAKHALAAAALACLLTAAALAVTDVWPFGQAAVFLLAAAAVTYGAGSLLAASASRKLGGLTGDVYGALNECIELALLLAAVAYLYNS
ncbi:adenosylcobinamide-GDP ribazoletransferase [Cohnella thermotolerans]|uniref:adenosylcobinamide-GDP ribazoletransferase n=1 Tax=Cohnella thermotolerans TaxID=329858 RepID=UPI00047E846B|nr:adenosylcobinamide-GDP ribazoletransferase [Cohnella thermotolerans]